MKTVQNNKEHTDYPLGSVGHYKHYANELERIRELAENAKGKRADELYLELDGIRMILEEYKF